MSSIDFDGDIYQVPIFYYQNGKLVGWQLGTQKAPREVAIKGLTIEVRDGTEELAEQLKVESDDEVEILLVE